MDWRAWIPRTPRGVAIAAGLILVAFGMIYPPFLAAVVKRFADVLALALAQVLNALAPLLPLALIGYGLYLIIRSFLSGKRRRR